MNFVLTDLIWLFASDNKNNNEKVSQLLKLF